MSQAENSADIEARHESAANAYIARQAKAAGQSPYLAFLGMP